MTNFASLINQFRRELQANPQIALSFNDFEARKAEQEVSWLTGMNNYLEDTVGGPFPLPEEDRQLLALPRELDIAWATREGEWLVGGTLEYMVGCLNLCEPSTAFAEPTYEDLERYTPQELELTPELRTATLFDCGSAANTTTHLTYLLYDEATRQYHGLALEYGSQLLRLSLSLGDYVRAALRWYGGWGWQFLYVSLDDFDNLVDGSTRIGVYSLCDGLPELFPQADWSIIAEKQDYFDIARPHALNYRQRNRRR